MNDSKTLLKQALNDPIIFVENFIVDANGNKIKLNDIQKEFAKKIKQNPNLLRLKFRPPFDMTEWTQKQIYHMIQLGKSIRRNQGK